MHFRSVMRIPEKYTEFVRHLKINYLEIRIPKPVVRIIL